MLIIIGGWAKFRILVTEKDFNTIQKSINKATRSYLPNYFINLYLINDQNQPTSRQLCCVDVLIHILKDINSYAGTTTSSSGEGGCWSRWYKLFWSFSSWRIVWTNCELHMSVLNSRRIKISFNVEEYKRRRVGVIKCFALEKKCRSGSTTSVI